MNLLACAIGIALAGCATGQAAKSAQDTSSPVAAPAEETMEPEQWVASPKPPEPKKLPPPPAEPREHYTLSRQVEIGDSMGNYWIMKLSVGVELPKSMVHWLNADKSGADRIKEHFDEVVDLVTAQLQHVTADWRKQQQQPVVVVNSEHGPAAQTQSIDPMDALYESYRVALDSFTLASCVNSGLQESDATDQAEKTDPADGTDTAQPFDQPDRAARPHFDMTDLVVDNVRMAPLTLRTAEER